MLRIKTVSVQCNDLPGLMSTQTTNKQIILKTESENVICGGVEKHMDEKE